MFMQYPSLHEPEPPPVLLASRFFVESTFSEQSTGARLKGLPFLLKNWVVLRSWLLHFPDGLLIMALIYGALTLNYVCTLYETEYLASRNLAPLTRLAYLRDLNELTGFLEEHCQISRVDHVERRHLEGFLANWIAKA
jgi:hypothetical protein